jgi:Zn-finger nucleic acid-binding protein
MSALPAPACPTCHAALSQGATGDLNFWSCPTGDGLAFTVSEAYTRLQEDEVARLWELANAAAPGPYACPICTGPMRRTTVGYDDDEIKEGEKGDAPDTGSAILDICAGDQFVWFNSGELDLMPQDKKDAKPSPEETANIDKISRQFGHDLTETWEKRDSPHGLVGAVYRHVVRHPGFLGVVDHMALDPEAIGRLADETDSARKQEAEDDASGAAAKK